MSRSARKSSKQAERLAISFALFSPTAIALGSSASLLGFFAANGFRLPKGSLECSSTSSLRRPQNLLRFFGQMALASKKVL